MDWKSMLEASLKAARDIAQRASDEGRRSLTSVEVKAFDGHMAKADQARAKLKEIEESDARFQKLAAIDGSKGLGQKLREEEDGLGDYFGGGSAKAGQVLSFKSLAHKVKSNMAGRGGFRVKSLVSAGSQVTTAETLTSPVTLAQPATGLLDLMPVRFLDGTDQYSYLRQTTRTNNAAPVAAGALKPTSVYTLERVTRELSVIAHVSEPIFEYWLSDEPALEQFIGGEMGYGLQIAVEDQVLNGDGTGENMSGLLNASGLQTQAYNTSQIRTVRSGITKVEVLGYTASGIVLNPLDWEAIETAEDANERYLMGNEGSPIDRAARRLWGVPVALTTVVTQGSGILLSDGAAGIVADRRVDMHWGVIGDMFHRNQVSARVEGRFGVEVLRPTGIVELTLHA